MRKFIATLESIARYSQSRNYEMEIPKGDKETNKDYEARTWRYRAHADREGFVVIPPTSFKRSLDWTAGYISMQIPGRGKSTYTKRFRSGVLVPEGVRLPVKRDEIEGEWLSLSGRGIRGQQGVWKCMPYVDSWQCDLTIIALDDLVTEEVLRYHLEQAGAYCGIGRFRPEVGGYYGRFRLDDLVEAEGAL